VSNTSLFSAYDVAYQSLDDTALDWDLTNWNQTLDANFSMNFRSNKSFYTNLTDGVYREFIDNATYTSCNGTARSLWVAVTMLGLEKNESAPTNDSQIPDFELYFYSHQGKPIDPPPTPPVPPPPVPPVPPTPPRPVPYDKNVTITELAFKDRDGGKTFEMNQT